MIIGRLVTRQAYFFCSIMQRFIPLGGLRRKDSFDKILTLEFNAEEL